MTTMKKLIESVDKIEEGREEDRFPEFFGGYLPPFAALSSSVGGQVLDSDNNVVLECKNPKFARVVARALNQYVRNN